MIESVPQGTLFWIAFIMKKMIRRNFFLTFVFGFLLTVGACKQPATNNTNPNAITRERVIGKPGGGLVSRLTSPPKTFNPLLAADEASLTTAFFLLNSRL